MNFRLPRVRPLLLQLACAAAVATTAFGYTPTGPALASGQAKFLGGVYSPTQAPNLTAYFNQITPENAGKWGSVEATRGVMNWAELDAAYALAKSNGMPFRMHVLVWGNQQPAWIETLSAADQLAEIEAWFTAVATRYPGIDYIDVVNEPLNQPPNSVGHGNYLNALGGTGSTGWDWVLTAFRMARRIFPATTRLMLNEYNIENNTAAMQRYVGLVRLVQAEGLIDAVGVQAHAFSTTAPTATIKANLDLLAATGLPIIATEMEIDGPTDAVQLADYQRIFPIFWEHPSVIGITLWGYLPGLWRDAQHANLALADGTERPALVWLRSYLANHPPVVKPGQTVYVGDGATDGAHVGSLEATDADGFGTLRQWQIVGGTGAGVFAVNASTGQVTVANASALNAAAVPSYTLNVNVSDGRDVSATESVSVQVHAASAAPTRLVNIATRAYCATGDSVTIGGFVVTGGTSKQVLVRAVGPTLTSQGLGASEVLTDPMVEVHKGSAVIAQNDNWGDNANAADIVSVGARIGANPLQAGDSTSSALLLTLSSGVYSFVVKGRNDASGIVLLEVYDADAGSPGAKFVNIATRAYATTGNGVAIGGFVIVGTTPKQVLMRAVGPTLTTQGIGTSEVLVDPVIELHKGSATLATNDNWAANANAAAIVASGARIGATPFYAPDRTSAALLMTLQPGVYSFIAQGKNASSGIVLVEVYDAD